MLINFFLTAFPVIAVFCALIYIPVAIYINRRFSKQSLIFHIIKYAFVGYVLSLVYLTILWYFPDISFSPKNSLVNLKPFVWIAEEYSMGREKMTEQLVLNIGMFIPLGLLMPLAVKKARRFWIALVIVLSSTVLIETVQFFIGRSADIDDVIMNFIGGALGYLIFMLLRKIFSGKEWWIRTSLTLDNIKEDNL